MEEIRLTVRVADGSTKTACNIADRAMDVIKELHGKGGMVPDESGKIVFFVTLVTRDAVLQKLIAMGCVEVQT